jgi:thiamine-monophosphate kinase
VQDLGEQAILRRLFTFCPTEVVGDDAALLTLAPEHCLVVTTDMLVDQVHFSDRTTHPTDVGWRAAAANLSDLAAMGATPLGITVSLGLPGALPIHWVEDLYRGLVDCLSQFNTAIVGGDVCRSSVITVGITAFGQVHPRAAWKRKNAKPGDAILVTGVHGASKAGLELLLHLEQGQNLDPTLRDRLIRAHQRPCPRLDVISLLWQIVGRAESEEREGEEIRIAAMDSSDGLADAVIQICRASGVGARLERDRIPLPEGLTNWVSEETAIDWALYGGEDFELVLCLPFEIAEALAAELGGSAAIVGRMISPSTPTNVVSRDRSKTEIAKNPASNPAAQPSSLDSVSDLTAVILTDPSGTYPDQNLTLNQGFQHF